MWSGDQRVNLLRFIPIPPSPVGSEAGITVPPLGREVVLHCAIRRLITGPELSPEVGFVAGGWVGVGGAMAGS